jgi:hypothetical protein
MPQKLETVLKHVEEMDKDVNKQLIKEYHKYLVSRDTSTNYQKDNIKFIYMFGSEDLPTCINFEYSLTCFS